MRVGDPVNALGERQWVVRLINHCTGMNYAHRILWYRLDDSQIAAPRLPVTVAGPTAK
ncbi:MAG: hypothetical protein NTY19_20915 [Planctomycetota bacterium]|nr:hypothetical protein [Planctomycetota bacterium]